MRKIVLLSLLSLTLTGYAQMRLTTNETFENSKLWPLGSYDAGNIEMSGGLYKIWHTLESGSWSVFTPTGFRANDDFKIKTRLKQTKGAPTDAFGLYLLQDDTPSNYFYITSGGFFEIIHNDVSIAKGASAAIKPMGNFNVLEIAKEGTKTTFKVNDVLVFECSDKTFTKQKVGWSLVNNNEILIDDLQIYTDPKELDYFTDFDDSEKRWYVGGGDGYTTFLEDGNYVLDQSKKDGGRFLYITNPVDWNQNVTIETEFRVVRAGTNDGFGIQIKSADDVTFSFYITSNNSYVIRRIVKDESKVIRNQKTPFNIDFTKPVRLTMQRSDNDLRFSLNGNNFETIPYSDFEGDKVGFLIYDNMRVEVNFLRITQIPRTIHFVENRFNGYVKTSLGPNVNSESNESSPTISSDGNTLFFIRDDSYEVKSMWGKENQDIYTSTLNSNGEWSPAKNVGFPLNNDGPNFVISISPDMNSLLVGNTYDASGNKNGEGVSIAKRTLKGDWAVPVQQYIHDYNNKNEYVGYALSPDNKVLIVAQEGDDSMGDLDLYVCFLMEDETWSKPQHMGHVINSYDSDFSPFIAADNKTLYFSSNGLPGLGNADVFISRRLDDTWLNWSEPLNLGEEINTSSWDAYFKIPASGNIAYLSSYENSMGKSDIFRIELPKEARPESVVLLKGKVLNAKTKKPLDAVIRYRVLASDEEIGIASSNPKDGYYQIALPYGEKYSFMAEKEGYYSISDNIDLSNLEVYTELEKDLYLAPIEKGEVIRLNNLFFGFDSAELLAESNGELSRLLKILQQSVSMRIEIGGHTDNKGTDAYNLNLSNQRAASVVQYLIARGIDSNRLVAKGYGESKPLATNDTEVGREQNRRVEFTILEK